MPQQQDHHCRQAAGGVHFYFDLTLHRAADCFWGRWERPVRGVHSASPRAATCTRPRKRTCASVGSDEGLEVMRGGRKGVRCVCGGGACRCCINWWRCCNAACAPGDASPHHLFNSDCLIGGAVDRLPHGACERGLGGGRGGGHIVIAAAAVRTMRSGRKIRCAIALRRGPFTARAASP